ncbi:MAG: hypothetical protein VZR06_01730 [Butyrivibrio sp.]|nr:hypothetical protein [Butyrivibrio sp.]
MNITTNAAGMGIQKSGWNLNAPEISPFKSANQALVVPQPRQDMPVRYFMGHPIPVI